ncbi:hypothetical protein [Acetobacter oeni]|uniref:Uncharacterized protein n=1 Tax=Acetobacter oeni TaxID=304077 RepID=A0A511XJP9_9PROT|nr:hypothetical protein [Acetobacter oeni]MBB3883399.1 hypothetical protein [Acetobacter oeni]NHO19374.1 hypothetical protein [Acetobacter oeni]GBR03941.1 hypothetical protein AA21952_1234 [Acetobacter oeni LMG 21952]GEN63180.1 hypothetical protein AOE01nite_14040 [Acetobacter oeni]
MPCPYGMAFTNTPSGAPHFRRNICLPASVQRDQRIIAGVVNKLEAAVKFAREQLATLDDTKAPLTVTDVVEGIEANIEANIEDMREDPQVVEDRWMEDA